MCVRYSEINSSPTFFSIKEKHQTLLRMNNDDRPAIHVEVSLTEFDGYKVIFGDYKNGDAPILIVNTLLNENIYFSQKEDLYYLYFYLFYFILFYFYLDEHNYYHHNIMFIIHGWIHLNQEN